LSYADITCAAQEMPLLHLVLRLTRLATFTIGLALDAIGLNITFALGFALDAIGFALWPGTYLPSTLLQEVPKS